VALILALNPGNSHSPTLSRLARELHGCELIGAESCKVAINAIKERVPDVVLLPAKTARGEGDLIAHLKSIPGGVLTLKLPPVDTADPLELAGRIRQMLTGAPVATPAATASVTGAIEPAVPVATPPHLIAAANATIKWMRTRRAVWADEQLSDVQREPVAQSTGVASSDSAGAYDPTETEDYERYQPLELSDAPDQYARDDTHETDVTAPRDAKTWLPRAAALAAIIGIAGAAVLYWPQIRGVFNGAPPQVEAPDKVSQPAAAMPAPVVTAPAADAKPDPAANPLAEVSGWIAVFSPFDVHITEGGQAVLVDDRGRAMLPSGRHSLRFQNLDLGFDETRAVDVRPTETTTVNLTPQTAISVTSNAPAEVWIDGARAGDTPFDGRIGLGTHSVTVRTAGGERQLTVEATGKPVQLEVDFSQP
jgi:hypothetical protein